MIDKYGSDAALTDVHHYETTEIKDQYDRLVIGSGFEVDEDFTVSYTTFDNVAITANPVKAVTNYEYEVGVNEDKRQIRVLKSTNADSLQHVVDSLHDELFIQSTNVTRYEIAIETLKENYPQAAEQFDECLKNTE
jgi:predicted class III extradiol MEMO1 family dioxygenase